MYSTTANLKSPSQLQVTNQLSGDLSNFAFISQSVDELKILVGAGFHGFAAAIR